MEMFHSTMRFLENKLKTTTPGSDVDNDYITNILDKQTSITNVDEFIELFMQNQEYIDYYIYLDIVGLHTLLYKHDCDGYYSVGNAIDILRLLDNIKPFITIQQDRLPLITRVFKKSVRSKSIITIL